MDSSMCRRCGAEEETSAHVFYECKALVTLRHTYLGSFFLDPENVRGLSLWAVKGAGFYVLEFSVRATGGLSKAYMCQDQKGSNSLSFLIYSFFPRSNHSHYMVLNYKIMYLVNGYLSD